MPRSLTTAQKYDLENPEATDVVPVVLATISHRSLPTPIYVNSDNCNYRVGAVTYTGVMFDVVLVSDRDEPARAVARMQNIDGIVGRLVQNLPDPVRIDLDVYDPHDFQPYDAVTDQRSAKAGAVPMLSIYYLELGNVRGNIDTIEGELKAFDFSDDPYPAIRTTMDEAPALYLR